jgi:paraquat-inducible protein B
VKFKGVQIGAVKNVLLNVSELSAYDTSAPQVSSGKVRIPVIIELDQDALTQKGGRLKPDPKTVKRLVDLGLRGKMAMESFVTGLLYVKLDMQPGSELNLVADSTVSYHEIPTLPTPLEEMQVKAAEFFAKLQEADIKGMVDHLTSAIKGIDALVNSPKLNETLDTLPTIASNLDGAIARLSKTLASVEELAESFDAKIDPLSASLEATAKNAREALRAATNTLNSTDAMLQPNSSVMFQLGGTLSELSEAARAIRRFAEDLERNPSMLVRGKAIPEEKK